MITSALRGAIGEDYWNELFYYFSQKLPTEANNYVEAAFGHTSLALRMGGRMNFSTTS